MRIIAYLLTSLFLFYPLHLSAAPINEADPLHLDWVDKSIDPSENFFRYANANWQKNNPIPATYPSWDAFHSLQKRNLEIIRGILEDAAKHPQKPNSDLQKAGDFYFSGMDVDAIERQGVTPLKSEFEAINNIKTKSDLQRVIAHLQMIGIDVLFNFGQMQDFANSKDVIGVANQGGLGLPDRDYYLKDTPKFKHIREVYIDHVKKMFILLGDDAKTAAANAKTVFTIETALAKASLSVAETRDPRAIYHIMQLRNLKQVTPHFNWNQYFIDIGYPKIKLINLGMPNFFKEMDQKLSAIALEDWKQYLRWHLIQDTAPFLSKSFVDEHFRLTKAINGSEELLPRWERVVNEENNALGFAVGKLYVEKMFPPSSKKEVISMINNIHKALQKDLETLSWMTPETRKAALKKLSLMKERIGYPDRWRDYSSLMINRGPYVLNVLRANLFSTQYQLNKIGKPVNLTDWDMTPQTVNAYYDPSMNNLNIPAGILQPPFFDPKAPLAVNYGAIGFIIGHEMTHGFDDEGAKFDGHGNLKDWWRPIDLKKFRAVTQCIIEQFSQYTVDGTPIQGKLVSGEAIADLGGLNLSYRAFQALPSYKQAKTIDGYTKDQQFFLSAAHIFTSNMRPEESQRLLTMDPHPPAMYRVNGSLANTPAFQKAYNIKPDSPMVRRKLCVIW